jgi:hypothetical protein
MQRRPKVLEVVAALAVLALLAYIAYTFIDVFSRTEASVKAAIIAGLFAVFSVIATHFKERSNAIKEAHRDKKIEVYSIFYDMIFESLKSSKNGETVDFNSNEFQDRMMLLYRGIMFYGSAKVVLAFCEFRLSTPDGEDGPLLVMKRVGKVLLAMREDIGLSNSGLDELSIHQVFVTDDLHRLGANR